MNTRLFLRCFGGLLVMCAAWNAAYGEGDYVMHARVSYDVGSGLIKGTQDAEWSHAPINTLVLPGDTLWADQGGTVEMEFPAGSFLRMADGSKAEVRAMPPSAAVRGWQGAFYIQRLQRSTGAFVFETPTCTLDILSNSCVRIDVVENGATTVSVHWGQATVRGNSGGVATVREGFRTWVDPGLLPASPAMFDRSVTDVFDSWNREQNRELTQGVQTLPKTVQIQDNTLGVSTLSRYGEWVYVDNRSYWRPTIVTDYVPYRHGSWSHVTTVGSVWVGDYPFSYTTSHYGRWHHHASYGWIWSYDPVWSPAWAATVRCGDYFVWAPIGYDYRPVVYDTAYFDIGGVHFSLSACSYAPATHLYYGSRYVMPIQRTIVHYIQQRPREINIWNIGPSHHTRVRVPYNDSVTRVRDYNPRRSIRGPVSTGDTSYVAKKRVRSLESSIGRRQFAAPKQRTIAVNQRTHVQPDARSARMHTVRTLPQNATSTARRRSSVSTTAPRKTAVRSPQTRTTAPTTRNRSTTVRNTATPTQRNAQRPVTKDTSTENRSRVIKVTPSRNRTRTTTPNYQRSTPERKTAPSPSYQRNTPERKTAPSPSYQRSTPSRQTAPAPSHQRSAPSRQTAPAPSYQRSTPSRKSAPASSYQRSTPSRKSVPSPSYQRSTPSRKSVPAPSYNRSSRPTVRSSSKASTSRSMGRTRSMR